jgi:hypothetical protein
VAPVIYLRRMKRTVVAMNSRPVAVVYGLKE